MNQNNLIITYREWSSLAPLLKENVSKISRTNKNWKVMFFDDAGIVKFLREEYSDAVVSAFLRIDSSYGAARADLFRYLALYKLGGAYIDIKSSIDQPLDSWIKPEDEFIIAQWSSEHLSRFPGTGVHRKINHVEGGEYLNWFMFSRREHPFLRHTIDSVLKNLREYSPFLHGLGKRAALNATGPVAFTLAVNSIINDHPHRFVRCLESYGIHYSILEADFHTDLFPGHYSTAQIPLVKISSAHWKLYTMARFAKRLLVKV